MLILFLTGITTVAKAQYVQVTADADTVCLGGKVTFTAHIADPDDYHYNWYNTSNWDNYIGSNTLTISNLPMGRSMISVAVIRKIDDSYVGGNSIPVVVHPIPMLGISSMTPSTICGGGEVSLETFIADGIAGGEVYTWYRNGKLLTKGVSSVLRDYPSHIGGDSTKYSYTVTVEQAARGCTSNLSLEQLVIVKPEPKVVVTALGNQTICENTNLVLEANVTPPNMLTTYQWYLDGAAIPNATQSIYTVNKTARGTAYKYHVAVNQLFGCTPDSKKIPIMVVPQEVCETTVGIQEQQAGKFRIYPNPTKGQLTIENGELTIVNVEIFSIVGQNVGVYPCGRPETIIDVQHLANGMYFLRIGDRTVRFVKE